MSLRRTLISTLKWRSEKIQVATFPCTHKVTGRPICAVPCDGVFELCKDDADEQCEGPGLMMVLVYTFVAALVFLLLSIVYDVYYETRKDRELSAEMLYRKIRSPL